MLNDMYLRYSNKKRLSCLKSQPWGNSHKKRTGRCSSELLKRIPKRYQDLVLWVWLEMFFTPDRYQFKKKNNLPSYFFRLNTLKAPAVDVLGLNTLRGTDTYVEHLCLFSTEVTPRPGLRQPALPN